MVRHSSEVGNNNKSNVVDSTTDRQERRRIMKHNVEKKRRSRINNCLEQMRILVLKAQNKNPENYTKMEKADIMEMTTNFLYVLNQQKTVSGHITVPNQALHTTPVHNNTHTHISGEKPNASTLSTMMQDYSRGYNTCQSEIHSYLQKHNIPVHTSSVVPIGITTVNEQFASPIAMSTPIMRASSTRTYSVDSYNQNMNNNLVNRNNDSNNTTWSSVDNKVNGDQYCDSLLMVCGAESNINRNMLNNRRCINDSLISETNVSSVNLSNASSASAKKSNVWRPF